MPRKTTGCWTCRARKKKCDDARPSCAACLMRHIECYGYDEKPVWMDGGEVERNMLRTMKQRAKESYSQRRRSRAKPRPGVARTEGAEGSVNDSTLSPQSRDSQHHEQPGNTDDGGTRCDGAHRQPYLPPPPYASFSSYNQHSLESSPYRPSHQQQPLPPPQPYAAAQPPSQTEQTPVLNGSADSHSETELSLLMYYFDHVFHRISPFFIYSAGDKGRGWLLSLFLRTRPLCAAAVCISACDQAQFVLGPLSDAPEPYHDLEMKHIHIVRDLRAHLAHLSQQTGVRRMSASVEALACIIHLIFFELWIPRKAGPDWVAHMDAAAALLSSLDTTMNGPSGSPVSTSSCSTPKTIQDFFSVQCLSDSERSAFDFFLTQYTVFFVISAVSLDLTPQSAESVERTRAIFHRGQTKIIDIFGIEDWVMVTLLDIAVLKAWKQRERANGTLSLKELARRADAIEDRINQGLADLAKRRPGSLPKGPFSATEPSEPKTWVPKTPSMPQPTRSEKIYMVTSTHLHAALLLLHIVVSGFYPHLPEIRRGVLATLDALEYMREHCDVNINSWPMCVAGCLALETEHARFRALLPPLRTGQHPLVLTKWTLNIVVRCWEMRAAQSKTEEAVGWVAAMNDLGTRLLLI